MREKFFTIIELLVVLAVIIILASLLMPAFSKAKECAKGIGCSNNLRQFGLAWVNYGSDYDYAPPYCDFSVSAKPGWDSFLALYLPRERYKTNSVWICPASGNQTFSMSGGGWVTYAMNFKFQDFMKTARIQRPGAFLISDMPLTQVVTRALPTDISGTMGFIHSGALTRALFCDTHTEPRPLRSIPAGGSSSDPEWKNFWDPFSN
jgi:hypothetical protein